MNQKRYWIAKSGILIFVSQDSIGRNWRAYSNDSIIYNLIEKECEKGCSLSWSDPNRKFHWTTFEKAELELEELLSKHPELLYTTKSFNSADEAYLYSHEKGTLKLKPLLNI